ncbi:MAG TPA: hypothetical protein VM238_21170 [Phycisphaerae bacterium]|nr:hypothetical protein [Phycisphaerae bacterium]
MAAIHGFDGNVTFANGYTTNVKAWTAAVSRDTEEALAWDGDGWFRAVHGGKHLGGTYTCNVDDSTGYSISDMVDVAGAAVFRHTSGWQLRVTIAVTGSDTGADIMTGPQEITFNWIANGKPVTDPPGSASITVSNAP